MSHLGSVGRRALSIGIAAAAAGVTAPALAQTGQPTLSAEGATFGAPIRAVSLDLAGDVIYDSNILGARQGTEGLRGVSKDDIILRPSLEALITLPAGPVQLGLNGSLGYNFHTENKQLDSERIDVNATASVNRGGCGAIVNGGLFRSQNELRDLSIEVGDPEASSVNI